MHVCLCVFVCVCVCVYAHRYDKSVLADAFWSRCPFSKILLYDHCLFINYLISVEVYRFLSVIYANSGIQALLIISLNGNFAPL